jgi:hypothetical protein
MGMSAEDEAQKWLRLAYELREQADAAERMGRLLLMQSWSDRAAE